MLATGLVKGRLEDCLLAEDYAGLRGLGATDTAVIRALIGLSYDKKSLLAWRAMDAIGRLSKDMKHDKVRSIIQRVLWMMREESSSNAWTGPEILGEIVANNPKPYEDIAPIIVSFHDELIMHDGVLRSMGRIAESRPDLMAEFQEVPLLYLDNPEPKVRGYAALALLRLDRAKFASALSKLATDHARFKYYDGHDLLDKEIAALIADESK